MNINTNIANAIDVTDKKAQYDSEVKHLLAQKEIFARILHDCVDEFHHMDLQKIQAYISAEFLIGSEPVDPDVMISEQNTEDVSVTDGLIRFDLLSQVLVPGKQNPDFLTINLEAQKKLNPGYDVIRRSVYYASRLISRQKNRVFSHDEYQKVQKVYSIWIFVDPTDTISGGITMYRLDEHCISGNNRSNPDSYDLIRIVHVHVDQSPEIADGAVGMLSVLLSDRLTKNEKKKLLAEKYQISMTKEIDGRLETMCNLSEAIEQKGIIKGKEEGLLQGKEEGMRQGQAYGRIEGRKETAVNLITMGFNDELIHQATELSIEEIQTLRNNAVKA